MTNALLDHVPEIQGNIFEPCSGDLSIANVLRQDTTKRITSVVTNDIDTNKLALYHFDASKPLYWAEHGLYPDWVVTNPPYDHRVLLPIVQNSLQFAKVGVAMLLRLSFEEPTKTGANARGPFFDNPDNFIDRRLVMPRYSFTGDGKSDSVTVAWMIWGKGIALSGPPNLSIHKAMERYG